MVLSVTAKPQLRKTVKAEGIFGVGVFCSFRLAEDHVNGVLLLTCFTLPIGMEHGTYTDSMARLN
jgi:hypothetical protein